MAKEANASLTSEKLLPEAFEFKMFKSSISIVNLAIAIGKVQESIDPIKKDAINPYYKSKYVTLDAILKELKPELVKEKIVLIQMPSAKNVLCTLLVHTPTGEFMESYFDIQPVESTPQALGSAITYARRYVDSCIFQLTAEDDDGNSASGKTANKVVQSAIVNNTPVGPTTAIPNTTVGFAPKLPVLTKEDPSYAAVVQHLVGGGSIDKVKLKFILTAEMEKELLTNIPK